MALVLPRSARMSSRTGAAILLIALCACAAPRDSMQVRAVQHRAWWEVRYPDGTITANELHIPANRKTRVDVSLERIGIMWSDHGDLRIGRHAMLTFSGPSTVYTPKSKLQVIADNRFDEWLAHERTPARRTNSPGEAVFMTARCTLCHSVRGVAIGELPDGPDLTHVATRRTLAAGVIANDPGNLSGWVVDPETIKPGAGMPVNNIDASDLQALLAYLQTLR